MSDKKEKEERYYALKQEGTDEAVKLDKDHKVLLDSMIRDKANAIKLFYDHLQKGVKDNTQPLVLAYELANAGHIDLSKKVFKIFIPTESNDDNRKTMISMFVLIISEKGTKNQLIRYINSFIQDFPKWDHLYVQRAQYYDDSEKFEKAINDFNMAIKLNPVRIDTYGLRADTYTKMKKFDKALEDYNILVSENPTEDSYFRRFDCYDKKENAYGYLDTHEKQMRSSDIDNAYKMNNSPKLLLFRGIMRQNEGNPRDAISDYETLLGDASIQEVIKDLYFAFPYRMKAECHLDIGELDAAKKDIKKALDLDDSDPKNYFLRSKIFYQNYENKFNTYKEILNLEEDDEEKERQAQLEKNNELETLANERQSKLDEQEKKLSFFQDEIKKSIMLAKEDVEKAIDLFQSEDNVYYTILCLKHRKKIIEANDDPRKKYKDLSPKEIKQIKKDLLFIVEHGDDNDDHLDNVQELVKFYKKEHQNITKSENKKTIPVFLQSDSKREVRLIEENKLLKKEIKKLDEELRKQFKKGIKKDVLIKENKLLETKVVELDKQLQRDYKKSMELLDKQKQEVNDETLQELTHRLKNLFGPFAILLNNFVNIIEQKFDKSLSDLSREPIAGENQGEVPTINDKIIETRQEWKYIENLVQQAKKYHNLTLSPNLVNKLDAKSKKLLKQPSKSNLRIHIAPNKKLSNVKVSIDIDQWKELLMETLNNVRKHNPNKKIDLYFNFSVLENKPLLMIDYFNNGKDGNADFLPYELGNTRFGLSFIKKIIDMHGFNIFPREEDNKFGFKIIMPIMNEGTR